MRAWRHWIKQLSQSWKECKEEPAFSCTSTLTKQYKVTYFYISLPVLWLIFFCYCLLPLLLPRVSSALLSSPSCLVAVWFWLLRCRQPWQVKQQGSWAALNAKLLACLKQKGEEEKIKKNSSFPSGGFLAALLISSRDACCKGENSPQGTQVLPSKNCHFHFEWRRFTLKYSETISHCTLSPGDAVTSPFVSPAETQIKDAWESISDLAIQVCRQALHRCARPRPPWLSSAHSRRLSPWSCSSAACQSSAALCFWCCLKDRRDGGNNKSGKGGGGKRERERHQAAISQLFSMLTVPNPPVSHLKLNYVSL